MNLTKSLGSLVDVVKECIHCENVKGGILEDVETIIQVISNEYSIEEPAIWIVQHPTVPAQGTKPALTNHAKLETTFEFCCVEYDEDTEIAELKGMNLATRVVSAILKNYRRIQKKHNAQIIHNIEFVAYNHVGEITIDGKSDKVPATSVILKFTHIIDWMNCCKKEKKGEK